VKRTTISTLAVAGVLALSSSACSDSTTAGDSKGSGKAKGDVTVGFSVYDMQYEYFQKMEKGTREAAQAKGWKFKLHDEKSDENEMVTGAQSLLDQGVDVLIISPFKPDALGPIIAKAKQKKIPVIIDDIGGGGTPYDAIVVSDNANGGKQAADHMVSQIEANGAKSKKVVSITCEPSAVYAARRNESFDKEIKAKGYEVVTELSGNSKAEEAYKIMKDALAKNPDVTGVFACNDPMGVAAANAIKDAGKDPIKDIVTIGFNADPEAITAIGKAGLSATIAQDPAGMGAKTVELAAQAVGGAKIAFDDESKREVFQKVTLVTKENVSKFAA
jgi:ribose transport system substrate-binding protein